ncbi:integrase [Vibrio crassostreae]|uniref:integrase domain-containing protein n=1 Tax=Vibrio crassostreae TaxID=246167 RepID=UPI00119A535D|nr:integrase domain-containing protein [Vibrio crassostreae]TWD72673.1 integrase [Vibrio crassostreae]
MARTTKPLTNTEIKQAKPKDKVYDLRDGQGLVLRIKPNSSKLWLFDYYRPYTKKRTTLSFGSYPEVSLAEARELRAQSRKLLSDNIDPKEHREQIALEQQGHRSATLEVVAKDWFEIKRKKVTPNYADDIWSSLKLHIFPALGPYPVSELRPQHAIDTMKPLAHKGNLETIKRLSQRLNEIMTFALNTGLVDANRLTGIKAAFETPKKKHMPTITPKELPGLMLAINKANIKLTTRCLIEWQLHTMSRPNEAAGAKWDEIDFDNKCWVIPVERMKMRKEHVIPLTEQTLGLLDVMKPISGHREFIFPSDRNPKTHINPQTANMALKRMNYKGKLVAHGLRALASTTLNEQGFDSDVIEAALSHIDSNEVRKAYNRADYLDRRKKLMAWWSNHISKASQGDLSVTGTRTLRAVG